jgi:glycosyltransferase involved in cell wall biosynthesis
VVAIGRRRTQPLSVCLVTGEYPPTTGGLADYSALLKQHLEAAGVRVAVLTAESAGVSPAHRGAAKTGADETPALSDSLCPDTRQVRSWAIGAAREWATQVADADVVHVQYQTAAFGMSPAVNLFPALLRFVGIRAPIVTTFHDLRAPYLFRGARWLRPLANHFLMGASDACIFTDPGDLARAHPRNRAVWIPIGSNLRPSGPTDRAAERSRLGIASEEVAIAHFGFANVSKGIDVLLRAAHRLVRAGVELKLLFVGDELGARDPTNVATAASLRSLASTLALEERIIRTGALLPAEVSSVLAAADVAALPFIDGASLRRGSLLACLAHGVPVVTTPPAAAPDVAPGHRVPPFDDPAAHRIDERIVALAPAGDDAALARELYRLINDPVRSHDLGRAGQIFAARLDWAAIARATTSVYYRVLNGR